MVRRTIAFRLAVKAPTWPRRVAAYFVCAVLGPDRAAEYLVNGMRFDVEEIPDPAETPPAES